MVANSGPRPVCSEVLQGSFSGPAFSLLYANNLPEVVTSSQVALFADDTKILNFFKLILQTCNIGLLFRDYHLISPSADIKEQRGKMHL